jgi:hypothetical protein
MGLPANFIKSIPRIRKIIRYTDAHDTIGLPVDIDDILKKLTIPVTYEPFEDFWIEGYSTGSTGYGSGRHIYVNANKPETIKRKVKAHELHHILEHGKELPLLSHIGHENKILEKEANYSAAYYLIPTKCISLSKEWGITYQELAERMVVPVDLVFKRYEIYTQLNEHGQDKFLIKIPMLLETD